MISIQGKGVSTGVAIGPLYYYQRAKSTIRRYEVEDVEAEWERFKAAQAKAIEQLGELAEKAREEAGDEAALLFETHLSVYKPPYVSLILECTLVRVGNCHSSCSSLYI